MKERAALSDRLRSFGPVTSREAVAKCLSDGRGLVARKRGLKVATLVGRRGYVPLAFRWRCGSGMTLSHSTQRTMPASCSSSVTGMEIMRLCIQARGGFVGRDCRARPDCPRFMMHLQGSRVEWFPLSLRACNQQCVARLTHTVRNSQMLSHSRQTSLPRRG